MTTSTTKTKEQSRIATARGVASEIGGAVTAGSKAYVSGILELSRTLGGFGREMLNDAGAHVRATMTAKSIREVAELQAAYKVPKQIVFIDALPKSNVGKILRRELRTNA